MTKIEISGEEIIGPNDDITYGEAMGSILIKSNKFMGRRILASCNSALKLSLDVEFGEI